MSTDLRTLFDEAQRSFPTVELSWESFEAAWAARAPLPTAAIVRDVYMATAIEERNSAALRWLQHQVQRGVQATHGLQSHLHADIESFVLQLVAVGSADRGPRIRDYAARGPLAGWLQVIIARAARERSTQGAQRLDDRALENAVLSDLEAPTAPPELKALRSRFEGQLGPSLRSAAERLTTRERALISLHYVEGVSLDELGVAYQVHRATISRWLVSARESFLSATRDELSQRTGVARLEVDSLVRALQSQVDVSLRHVLAADRAT